MNIKIVPAGKLYPFLGYANPDGLIEVADCLDNEEQQFVVEHEKYHLSDTAEWWVWREIRANVVAAYRYPFGFIKVLWRTLRDYRRVRMYLGQKARKDQ